MGISSGSKKQSTLQGVVNILLTAVGVGMLSLSASIAEAGWVLGFVMFFSFGVLAIFLCMLLDRSMLLAADHTTTSTTPKADDDTTTKTKEITKYEDIGYAAFGQWGYAAASIPLHASLVGCSCALMALLTEHSRSLMKLDVVDGSSRDGRSFWKSHEAVVMYWGVLMLPVTWLKTMKHVGAVNSTIGVGAVFVMLVSIVIEGFRVFAEKSKAEELPEYGAWPKNGVKSVGAPFAAFTLAFAVTCTVPTIIRDLEKREASKKVLTFGVFLTMAVYFMLTLAGYLAWGSRISGASIIENMDNTKFFTKVCKGSLILACACHYAVMLHPTCRALEDLAGAHEKTLMRTLLRSSLVAGTMVVAAFVTDLSVYVGILGSVTFAVIHSVLPPLFYWRLCHLRGHKLGVAYKAGLVGIMTMTVVGGYFGLNDALNF